MRKESEIKKELAALIAENHSKAQTAPAPEIRLITVKIKALQQELSDLYSDGANPCPVCKAAPIGMDRTSCYEIGCTVCRPIAVEVDGVTKRQSFSAQGRTPLKAVENWNAGNFLVDSKMDLLSKQ
jgi:hypothetical protein